VSFLAPLFLMGAAAAAVPILLHLLKREPEVHVKFAAVKLLQHAPVERTDRRRLRELLLLALRVAALLLLSLAFARPFFAADSTLGASGVTVIALDTSLSLAAPGQFARAQELAKAAVDDATAGRAIAVVAFADAAEVVAPPSGDRAAAKAAIDRAAPGLGGTKYRAAFAAAGELIATVGGSEATIVVVTDLQATGWDEGDRVAVPASAAIEIADVGPPPANLAVTAVRRLTGDRLSATIRNTGDEPREALVRLSIDGRPGREALAALGPNQTATVTLAGAPGAVAEVTVDDPDGIEADNRRYAVFTNQGRPGVAVVTSKGDLEREAFYVQQALEASGSAGAAYEVRGAAAADLGSWQPARFEGVDAVIVLSTRGLDRRGREALAAFARRGGGLLLAAGPDVDDAVAADLLGGQISLTAPAPGDRDPRADGRTLTPTDLRHPIFQSFGGVGTLGLVRFQRIAALGGDGCQRLARFTTGEGAMLECALGEGRAIVVASDLDNLWNDFPVHATFVPFLHETVGYLAGGRPQADELLIAQVPPGLPARPGVASIPGEGGDRRVAVNVDPAESEPARLSDAEFRAAASLLQDAARLAGQVEATEQESRQRIWRYVLALMIGMLVLESYVGARAV
jgi:hypothetical protein